jgi:hypothetical protein
MKQLEKFCEKKDIHAFPYVMLSKDFETGMTSLIQTAGIYPIVPNIVMLGWGPESKPFIKLLNKISLLKKSIIVLKKGDNEEIIEPKTIDVWWRGKQNGGMMLVLAHLMKENKLWKNSKLRLLRVIENEEGSEQATLALENIIEKSRVKAEAKIIVSEKKFPVILKKTSSNSDVDLPTVS